MPPDATRVTREVSSATSLGVYPIWDALTFLTNHKWLGITSHYSVAFFGISFLILTILLFLGTHKKNSLQSDAAGRDPIPTVAAATKVS